MQVNLS